MSEFYTESQRTLQDRFDSRRLADSIAAATLRTELKEMDRRFIAAADMFFLSTVDADGWPTVSYKGGGSGFVRVIDDRTCVDAPSDASFFFGQIWACGQVLTCVRPRVAASHTPRARMVIRRSGP
jgi:hypothetical protein